MGRFLPLVCVLMFNGLGIGWRAWVQWRRTGETGIVLFKNKTALEKLMGLGFLGVPVTLLVIGCLAAFSPETLAATGVVSALVGPVWFAAGVVAMMAAMALMLISQLQMGSSWRIGIEKQARPGLVTSGFYQFCRNPIYTWAFLWMIGMVMAAPYGITVALAVGVVLGTAGQVRREEAYLLEMYGDEYRDYAARVGRFVPGLGRLGR